MLIELYIFIMIIAFVFFFFAFFTTGKPNSEILWAVSAILFGILAVSSSVVQSLEPFFNSTDGSYYIASYNHADMTLVWVNVLFMAVSLLIFMMDILEKYKDGLPANPPKG